MLETRRLITLSAEADRAVENRFIERRLKLNYVSDGLAVP